MKVTLEELAWPMNAALAGGLEALFVEAGYALGKARLPPIEQTLDWVVNAPRTLGFAGALESFGPSSLLEQLSKPGPMTVSIPGEPAPRGRGTTYLLVIGGGLRCRVVSSDGLVRTMSPAELYDVVISTFVAPTALAVALADLEGASRQLARFERTTRLEQLTMGVVRFGRDGACALTEQLDALRGTRLVWAFVALSLVDLAVVSVASLTLGQAAVDGVVDRGRIVAWAMLSLVHVLLTYVSTATLGSLSILGSIAIKRRLLEGALAIDDRVLRTQGYGASLARLNEASVVERTSIAEIFGLLTPLGSWIAAGWVFSRMSVALPLLLVQLVATVFVVLVARRLVRASTRAYGQRLLLTEDLVDKIVGHRTRAIQENKIARHEAEDRSLAEYAATSASQDWLTVVTASAPRLFTLGSGAVLAAAVVMGASSNELLVGGIAIFLGMQALSAVSSTTERGAAWGAAWLAIRPLFAAGRTRDRSHRDVDTAETTEGLPTVVAASALSFAYRDGGRVILRDANVRVQRGEHVLIEGTSGGGKTTFAKLVAGELVPTSGSLLVGGVDFTTVSQRQWRRIVASAPQFHENHVFANTFAFNVDPRDGRRGLTGAAREICDELGLAPVLSRMPSGSAQLLGENGWQLSHGERSRIFVARALLQGAKVIVFDESFAALDPVTMSRVVECVRRRAPTLFVIAHV